MILEVWSLEKQKGKCFAVSRSYILEQDFMAATLRQYLDCAGQIGEIKKLCVDILVEF